MSVDSDLNSTSAIDSAEGSSFVDVRASVHETAVSEIVGMIRAKYEDEGTRNLAIGKRAYEHGQWQRGNFPGYTGSDFDTLMRRLRDDVRMFVPIKADSIRVDDWVRVYVLKVSLTEAIGSEAVERISFHEMLVIVAKALSFSKKDVEGSLVPGWADFVKEIAEIRANDGRVSAEDFRTRVAGHVKALEAAKAATDPVAAAAKLASDAVKATAKAKSKANEAITSSVSDALANGHVSPEGILGIVETVAKHHNVALPSMMGFDPVNCTVADCELLATAMFAAGKFTEMVALRDKLAKMVSAVEKARAAATSRQSVATAKVA